MNENEEGDEEVGKAVEDNVVGHTELGKVSPTPAVLCHTAPETNFLA